MSQADETRGDVVARGAWGSIRYATRRDGSRPAEEFLEDLDASDQQKLAALFERMAETGKIGNTQKFKKEEGHIFAFKSFRIRVGRFQVQRTWFLTHGFNKKSDHWPRSELDKAERIRLEHLNRATR